MNETDLAGWGAAGLTLLTFVCRDMRQLRLLAICANGAFITYGSMAGLVPVLVLHAALAPVNVWRLLQNFAAGRSDQAEVEPVATLSESRRLVLQERVDRFRVVRRSPAERLARRGRPDREVLESAGAR